MSENARRNFKTQTARLEVLLPQEEERLLRGPARNRVTGAGKHLRYRSMEDHLQYQRYWLKEQMKVMGLPHNLNIPKDLDEQDLRRVKGWLRAAAEHPPAMTVLGALYSLNSGKGVNSLVHQGGKTGLMVVINLWPSPLSITRPQAKMYAWWVKVYSYVGYAPVRDESGAVVSYRQPVANYTKLKNRKLLDILSKVSPLARWCIVTHPEVLNRKGDLTHRSVNWEIFYGLNKQSKVSGLTDVLKVKVLWGEEGFKSPEDNNILPRDISMAAMKTLAEHVRQSTIGSIKDPMCAPEMFDACLRLTLLFGKDTQAALRFVRDFAAFRDAEPRVQSLQIKIHDAAQKLPYRKDAKRWREFVLSSYMSPLFGTIMDNIDEIEEVCGGVPSSIAEVREKFRQAARPWDFDLNFAEKSFVRANEPKNFESCPNAVVVDGEYRLVKLESNDTRQLTAGRLVDCCQHLNGAGASCAAVAWTSGNCAIYAVFKADRMVAQTFAWRSDKDQIVFDSIEALSGVNRDAVLPMFVSAADQIVGQLGVRKVLVGATHYGITNDLIIHYTENERRKTPTPLTALGYSDAKSGCYVLSSQKLQQKYAKSAQQEYIEAAATPQVHNTFMPGSEVYCEHCEAEVHPACEVCPSCGQNIAEWVD